MNAAKYFWDLNDKELALTRRALADPAHPRFMLRMVTLLARCDQPKELFSILPKQTFIEAWPKIRSYWIKRARQAPYRDWWETLYEQLTETAGVKFSSPKGGPSTLFRKLGGTIKERRVELGISQKQLAHQARMTQSAISQIEEGKKNITLFTLARLCKILGIKSLEMD